jgi:mono/diheme cytochrome c family protein
MSFRTTLIVLNLVVFGGILAFIVYRVFSLRRNPEPKQPQNLETFFDDEVLEGPKLERVLFVSLISLVLIVLALVAYFLWEPFREADANAGFNDRSVARGATLFANNQSPHYDSTKSLLCANCHGVDAGGGTANFVIKSEVATCDPNAKVTDEYAAAHPECLPKQVAWQAPNLTFAALRYSSAQLTQIITYGRPGTPMPAWGVASGRGALDDQSIQDLVHYLESIKITPTKAKALDDVSVTRKNALEAVQGTDGTGGAKGALAKAQAALAALPATATADERTAATAAVASAQTDLSNALAYQALVDNPANEGLVLFESNCARCHTRGWSYYDPLHPNANPAPGPMGGGAYGPALTGGDENRQFPPPDGDTNLYTWIAVGVPANQGYGLRGISSGRMPHFGDVLTKEQIQKIMAYERSL